MSPGNLALLLVVVVLVLNQLVLRVGALLVRPVWFYGVMALDVVLAIALVAYGMPGLEKIPMMSVVVSLLMLMHAAQGLRHRPELLANYLESLRLEERAQATEIEAALLASEHDPHRLSDD